MVYLIKLVWIERTARFSYNTSRKYTGFRFTFNIWNNHEAQKLFLLILFNLLWLSMFLIVKKTVIALWKIWIVLAILIITTRGARSFFFSLFKKIVLTIIDLEFVFYIHTYALFFKLPINNDHHYFENVGYNNFLPF